MITSQDESVVFDIGNQRLNVLVKNTIAHFELLSGCGVG